MSAALLLFRLTPTVVGELPGRPWRPTLAYRDGPGPVGSLVYTETRGVGRLPYSFAPQL